MDIYMEFYVYLKFQPGVFTGGVLVFRLTLTPSDGGGEPPVVCLSPPVLSPVDRDRPPPASVISSLELSSNIQKKYFICHRRPAFTHFWIQRPNILIYSFWQVISIWNVNHFFRIIKSQVGSERP